MKLPILDISIHDHMELTPGNIWGRNHIWSGFLKKMTFFFLVALFGPYWSLFGPYCALFGAYWSLIGPIGPYLALTVKQKRNTEGPHRGHRTLRFGNAANA